MNYVKKPKMKLRKLKKKEKMVNGENFFFLSEKKCIQFLNI